MNGAIPDGKNDVSLQAVVDALVELAPRVHAEVAVRIRGVSQDSRRVNPGDLFVARAGGRADGLSFVAEAVARGAVAVVVQAGAAVVAAGRPVVEVADARRAVGLAAEAVYGYPSRALEVVGVTGTNGKTTCSWILTHLLGALDAPVARLGTLGYVCGDDCVDESLTTPAADEISAFLARARAKGARHFVMEVSSHALDQARVDALSFACALFTNLTQDHLDYHGSMAEYGAAKARLFTALTPRSAVIHTDDAFGRHLAARVPGVVTVGRGVDNAVHPRDVVVDPTGIRGTVRTPGGDVDVRTRLVGHHNLDNLLLGLGAIVALGLDVRAAAERLRDLPAVPGRFERCDGPDDDVVVIVDYAHTPDALRRVLEAVKPLSRGRVLCVFGCGGDRDADKRPKMGDAVGAVADHAIVTNDNPRSEDPEAIARAVVAGLERHRTSYDVVLDRSRAIERAVRGARPGDAILIAGKGHEPYQLVGDERRAFDDREQARRALAVRRRGGPG